MNYKIFSQEPQSHLLNIEMLIDNIQSETLEIQLPAWRPGRYELQHFAKNIQRFEIVDLQGNLLSFGKITKDRWRVNTTDIQSVKVVFTYFSNVQNAGSSFVDDSTMYINFVNCLPYVEGRMDEACEVSISLPDDYKIVCGLPSKVNEPNTLLAQDYYHLVDCPLLASPYLQHKSYRVADTVFFVWFLGNYIPNWEKTLSDFQKFTEKQIEIMGDFPEKDYHFMNWILPTSFYHGVEHRNSTMIVLGPASEGDGLYTDLLGVSSHELYHAWNICKIRPIEMMPYDFTKENYFTTGFVAEGVTTYFGDLFLVQSGVFNLEAYLKELETVIKRHFEQDGRAFQSLTESSYDLWLDGYSQAIPNRRVSIYQKGAVVALILDLMIRLKFGHRRSLGSIMQLMWERFGKTGEGYSIEDYQKVCEEVYAGSLKDYFKNCIEGNIPLEDLVNELLQAFGISMQRNLDGKIHLELLDSENENLKLWLNL